MGAQSQTKTYTIFFSEQLHLFENERNQLRQNGRRELQGRVARKIFRGQRLDRKFCRLFRQFFSLRHEFTTFPSVLSLFQEFLYLLCVD